MILKEGIFFKTQSYNGIQANFTRWTKLHYVLWAFCWLVVLISDNLLREDNKLVEVGIWFSIYSFRYELSLVYMKLVW